MQNRLGIAECKSWKEWTWQKRKHMEQRIQSKIKTAGRFKKNFFCMKNMSVGLPRLNRINRKVGERKEGRKITSSQ